MLAIADDGRTRGSEVLRSAEDKGVARLLARSLIVDIDLD